MYGPSQVLSVRHNNRYSELELPPWWKILPTFKVSLLERYQGSDPGKHIVQIEADDAESIMKSIFASGPSNDNAKEHVFLVKWEEFSHEDNTWESFHNVNDNARELLENFYVENPNVENDKRFGNQVGGDKKERWQQRNKKSIDFYLYHLLFCFVI